MQKLDIFFCALLDSSKPQLKTMETFKTEIYTLTKGFDGESHPHQTTLKVMECRDLEEPFNWLIVHINTLNENGGGDFRKKYLASHMDLIRQDSEIKITWPCKYYDIVLQTRGLSQSLCDEKDLVIFFYENIQGKILSFINDDKPLTQLLKDYIRSNPNHGLPEAIVRAAYSQTM